MAAEGYDVHLVVEASGNTSDITLHTTVASLTQHGVTCANWVEVACQLLTDWADEAKAAALTAIYNDHLPGWAMLSLIQDGAQNPARYRGPARNAQ